MQAFITDQMIITNLRQIPKFDRECGYRFEFGRQSCYESFLILLIEITDNFCVSTPIPKARSCNSLLPYFRKIERGEL